ncbi:conserved hypothetical protein [Ricinus communis]|uniref:Uncharacterized protein n=1 Tax=Ricinus communis TaxID=3988 RepID=B9SR61_RICCO|nr:conserved hypothetical protein [Ricinus communis]
MALEASIVGKDIMGSQNVRVTTDKAGHEGFTPQIMKLIVRSLAAQDVQGHD